MSQNLPKSNHSIRLVWLLVSDPKFFYWLRIFPKWIAESRSTFSMKHNFKIVREPAVRFSYKMHFQANSALDKIPKRKLFMTGSVQWGVLSNFAKNAIIRVFPAAWWDQNGTISNGIPNITSHSRKFIFLAQNRKDQEKKVYSYLNIFNHRAQNMGLNMSVYKRWNGQKKMGTKHKTKPTDFPISRRN